MGSGVEEYYQLQLKQLKPRQIYLTEYIFRILDFREDCTYCIISRIMTMLSVLLGLEFLLLGKCYQVLG